MKPMEINEDTSGQHGRGQQRRRERRRKKSRHSWRYYARGLSYLGGLVGFAIFYQKWDGRAELNPWEWAAMALLLGCGVLNFLARPPKTLHGWEKLAHERQRAREQRKRR